MADTDVTTQPSSDSGYILLRGARASTRLNLQHYIWRKELGWNIHPRISIPKTNARIADVAAGTGIWLMEVAEEHPAAQCHGFDISLLQTPPAAWLPDNVKMHQWDTSSSLGAPPDFLAHFDLIHVRLALVAFEDDAGQAMRNLLSMLKPGGWLQWDEGDYENQEVVEAKKTDGDVALAEEKASSALARAAEVMRDRADRDWCLNLPKWLGDRGFCETERCHISPLRSMLKYSTDTTIMVWEEVVETERGERKKMLDDLMQKLKAEAMMGGGLECAKLVTLARRPLPVTLPSNMLRMRLRSLLSRLRC